MKQRKIEVNDFGILFHMYLSCVRMTQDDFAKLILTTRQSTNKLNKSDISEVSTTMLYRLYYYFSNALSNANEINLPVAAKKRILEMETLLLDMVNSEIEKRVCNPVDDKPVRRRKK